MKLFDLISAANAASTVTSAPLDLGDQKNLSIHVKFSSATLVGTLKLQASNDNTDWVDITGSSQSVAAGESHIWNIVDATYRNLRVVWTNSAGTGTLTAAAVIKEHVIKGA
jgi:diaminopimelate epimerase